MSNRDKSTVFDAQVAAEGQPGVGKTFDGNVTIAAHHIRIAHEALTRAILSAPSDHVMRLDEARVRTFEARRILTNTNLIGPIAETTETKR